MAMAVSMASELGIERVAAPTAGNAGGALAAYAARAGMEAYVFMPADTPMVNRYEAALYGAHAYLVDGLINDCGAIVRDGVEAMGWFDMSTLKEPYRIEGKKTMGLELADQLDWRLPDVILYPTGGGTGLIGMWKAFAELETLGWLDAPGKPRLYSCQSDGCAPIADAWAAERALRRARRRRPHHRQRHPRARRGRRLHDPRRGPRVGRCRTGGRRGAAGRVDAPGQPARGHRAVPRRRPPASTCSTASSRPGEVDPDEQVVVFNTGAAQKYVEVMAVDLPTVAPPVDYRAI